MSEKAVKVGQVYQDNDSRFREHPPRYLRITKVDDGRADALSFRGPLVAAPQGARTVKVVTSRLLRKKYYKLVQDAE